MIVALKSHPLIRCDRCGGEWWFKAPRSTDDISAADVDDLRTLARRQGWTLAIVGGVFEDACVNCQGHHNAAP